jgi:hypothetical protein
MPPSGPTRGRTPRAGEEAGGGDPREHGRQSRGGPGEGDSEGDPGQGAQRGNGDHLHSAPEDPFHRRASQPSLGWGRGKAGSAAPLGLGQDQQRRPPRQCEGEAGGGRGS